MLPSCEPRRGTPCHLALQPWRSSEPVHITSGEGLPQCAPRPTCLSCSYPGPQAQLRASGLQSTITWELKTKTSPQAPPQDKETLHLCYHCF